MLGHRKKVTVAGRECWGAELARMKRFFVRNVMENMKRRTAIGVAGFALAVVVVFVLLPAPPFAQWFERYGHRPDVLEYPHAREIRRGMTPTQIRKLIGPPTNVEQSPGFPGDTVWTYRFDGWDDEIHVYFDHGHVVEFDYNHG